MELGYLKRKLNLFLYHFSVTLVLNKNVMETIRIQFEAKIKERILELLKSFSSDELQIIQEDPFFEENKAKLTAELDRIENGSMEYKTFDELNLVLEKRISGYEG